MKFKCITDFKILDQSQNKYQIHLKTPRISFNHYFGKFKLTTITNLTFATYWATDNCDNPGHILAITRRYIFPLSVIMIPGSKFLNYPVKHLQSLQLVNFITEKVHLFYFMTFLSYL